MRVKQTGQVTIIFKESIDKSFIERLHDYAPYQLFGFKLEPKGHTVDETTEVRNVESS